jgi:hypothetical protein
MNYIECVGEVRVARPVKEAIALFTPEGERAWAPGWDPVYPSGRPSTAPGTVFVTGGHGRTSTWVITEMEADRAGYARFVPDVQAGTISVRCRPDRNGTVARVVYRLTALDPAAEPELRAFADGFDDMMAAWERHIG